MRPTDVVSTYGKIRLLRPILVSASISAPLPITTVPVLSRSADVVGAVAQLAAADVRAAADAAVLVHDDVLDDGVFLDHDVMQQDGAAHARAAADLEPGERIDSRTSPSIVTPC